jgi:hypothetical protein
MLGRSQVVRQRLLMPRTAGSNPAAPASQSIENKELFQKLAANFWSTVYGLKT